MVCILSNLGVALAVAEVTKRLEIIVDTPDTVTPSP